MSKELPPMNRVPESLGERLMLRITEYGVASWCPTPDGSGPALAVALHFKVAGLDEAEFGLLLRSAERVNELIAMLVRHRNDVWPNAPKEEVSG